MSRFGRQRLPATPADDVRLKPDADGGRAADRSPARGSSSVVFTISGAVSLALEVVWFRVLTLFLRPTVYGFAVMLAMILVGISTGSFLVTPLLNRRLRWMEVLAATRAGHRHRDRPVVSSARLSALAVGHVDAARRAVHARVPRLPDHGRAARDFSRRAAHGPGVSDRPAHVGGRQASRRSHRRPHRPVLLAERRRRDRRLDRRRLRDAAAARERRLARRARIAELRDRPCAAGRVGPVTAGARGVRAAGVGDLCRGGLVVARPVRPVRRTALSGTGHRLAGGRRRGDGRRSPEPQRGADPHHQRQPPGEHGRVDGVRAPPDRPSCRWRSIPVRVPRSSSASAAARRPAPSASTTASTWTSSSWPARSCAARGFSSRSTTACCRARTCTCAWTMGGTT